MYLHSLFCQEAFDKRKRRLKEMSLSLLFVAPPLATYISLIISSHLYPSSETEDSFSRD